MKKWIRNWLGLPDKQAIKYLFEDVITGVAGDSYREMYTSDINRAVKRKITEANIEGQFDRLIDEELERLAKQAVLKELEDYMSYAYFIEGVVERINKAQLNQR